MASTSLASSVTGEETVVIVPNHAMARSRTPVMYLHGGGSSPYTDETDYHAALLEQIAAERPVMIGAWGGPLTWANDLCAPAIEAGRLRMVGMGLNAGTVILVTVSMGHGSGCRYADTHPTHVEGLAGIIPMCDLIDIYTNSRGIDHQSIGDAWGVTAPAALPARADVAGYASTFSGLAVPPTLWYSSSDTIIYPPTVTTFAAAAGGAAVDVGSAGHSEATLETAWPLMLEFVSQFA